MNLYAVKFIKHSYIDDMYDIENIKSFRKICIDEIKRKNRDSLFYYGYLRIHPNTTWDYAIDLDYKSNENSKIYNLLLSCVKMKIREVSLSKLV